MICHLVSLEFLKRIWGIVELMGNLYIMYNDKKNLQYSYELIPLL